MKHLCRLFMILLLGYVSVACSNTADQTATHTILFSDDFSNGSKNWDQVSDSSGSTEYYNDAFRIIVNEANYSAWANPGKESFVDTRVEVDAVNNAGPDDNEFGIICRYMDTNRFYYAVVSSDGYYGIMKMSSSGAVPIGRDSMLESDRITQGAATNHIRFDCEGSTLTLYVNGFQLDRQNDNAYTTGNVGLIAGTFATTGTDILFDNFIVYKPRADVQ
jgi:hypothetical protein